MSQTAPVTTGTKMFVSNLAWETNDRTLQELFARYGVVINAKVIVDNQTGNTRGFGFVTMESVTSAEKAISELNGSTVDGRRISVALSIR